MPCQRGTKVCLPQSLPRTSLDRRPQEEFGSADGRIGEVTSGLKVGIIGGTGPLGRGLASRLAAKHHVLIGSRSKERGQGAAAEIGTRITGSRVEGGTNQQVASDCDLAILAVPNLSDVQFLEELTAPLSGKIVVSPIVPMASDDGLMRHGMNEGSAAERVASVLKESHIVAAFHNLPALTLIQGEKKIEFDVLVACERRADYDVVAELVRSMQGPRPIYIGPLRMARVIEEITPLLLNAAKLNGLRRLSVKLVS